MPIVTIKSRTDRYMALAAVGFMSLFAAYGLYAFSRPIYWHAYATFIKPFHDPSFRTLGDDPFSSIMQQKQEEGGVLTGDLGRDPGKTQVSQPPATAEAKPKEQPQSKPPALPKPKELKPADYELSRELVMKHVQDGYVMVTWANEHYLDFAISWVANVRRQGITGYLVGAMDDDLLRQLVERDINCWRMNTGISKRDLGWGSKMFHQMGRAKIKLILQVMEIAPEVTVVVSDIDTAWLRNPIPFFNRFPDGDILTSSDQLRPSVRTEDLERWPEAGAAFNIGIMLFRPTSKSFVAEWIKLLEQPNMWDQNAFNDLSRRGAKPSEKNGLFPAFYGKLKMGILPVTLFASGQVFFVQRKHEEFGLKPYVAHATFQYSGTPGKRHRMREFMLWEDPPSYYDHPKGFISLKVDIPQKLLANATGKNLRHALTVTQTDSHFALVNYQLLHIRAGIALAQLTGRALIMPPIWCELDKYWSVLEYGSIPGSIFKRPFICPMDHIFELENGWAPDRPYGQTEEQMGPKVDWREYSFLQNPALPKHVSESRVRVEVCPQDKLDGCNDGSHPAPVKESTIRAKPGLNSDKILKMLKDTSDVKILEFSHADKLWPPYSESGGWFTDPAAHRRLVQRMRFMTAGVCCLQGHPRMPGWIWYDLQWDVPHRDRFDRKYDSWHIKVGDFGDIRPPRVKRRQLKQLA